MTDEQADAIRAYGSALVKASLLSCGSILHVDETDQRALSSTITILGIAYAEALARGIRIYPKVTRSDAPLRLAFAQLRENVEAFLAEFDDAEEPRVQ